MNLCYIRRVNAEAGRIDIVRLGVVSRMGAFCEVWHRNSRVIPFNLLRNAGKHLGTQKKKVSTTSTVKDGVMKVRRGMSL